MLISHPLRQFFLYWSHYTYVCTLKMGWNAYSHFQSGADSLVNLFWPSPLLISLIGILGQVAKLDMLKPLELGLWPRTQVAAWVCSLRVPVLEFNSRC
jgi:hypothetical protein